MNTDFKTFIIETLKITGLKVSKIKKLLSVSITFNGRKVPGLDLYRNYVFTAPCYNEQINYEFFEILGDSAINKAIVYHFTKRFQELQCPEGVKTIARLKIRYVSKDTFANLAKKLGFWKFIRASAETRERKMKPTLEDVFEAFYGATEWILNEMTGKYIGGNFTQKFINALFNPIPISLAHEDLYDAITRLKETQDYHSSKQGREAWNGKNGTEFGRIKYVTQKIVDEATGYSRQYVTIVRVTYSNDLIDMMNTALYNNKKQFWRTIPPEYAKALQKIRVEKRIGGPLARAEAPLLPDAKQKAALIALKNLEKLGLSKPIISL
jgi:dsRNA-specific ribonuclease